ncbi:MAG TPA: hypothetical protein VHE54_15455, partial [Puia sp.]|nr:hypothetical protein [Puia sp.]
SHPTLQERKERLQRLQLERPADPTAAWSLFDNAEKLQETMTARLYQSVKFQSAVEFYENREFEEQYRAMKNGYALPAAYKGFYDGRYIDIRDWDLDRLSAEPAPALRFDELFNEGSGHLQSAINSLRRDIETLNAIGEARLEVNSFDFDGVKHAAADAPRIASQLETEVAVLTEKQRNLDKQAFLYFLHRPGSAGVLANYSRWKQLSARYEQYGQTVNRLLQRIRPLYAGGLGLREVEETIQALKENEEAELKKEYRQLSVSGFLPDELLGRMQAFLGRDYAYFAGRQFRNTELEELKDLAIEVANAFNQMQFRWYKKMLVEQLEGVAENR